MLIRLLMTVFLFIASTMPALANDNANDKAEVSAIVKGLMEEGIDLYEEEILDNLYIEVGDRIEGDTYHISLAILNPTNTPLNKKIAYTTVTYDLCREADPYQTITQYTDTVKELAVEPFATSTIDLALKQPASAPFNHLTSCTFFFEDNSSLHFTTLGEESPSSPFHLTPIVSPFGEVSLKIQNYSPNAAVTELRDIRLNFTIGQESRKMLITEPISLQIKPSESYSIPLYTLSSANKEKSASPFSIGAATTSSTYTYNYHLDLKINGIPHTYINNYANATQISGSLKSTQIDTPDTHYQFAPKNLDPENGAFYLDGTNICAYAKVKNNSNTAVSSAQLAYRLTLPYFDTNAQYQEAQYTVRLPQDFNLAAKKSTYYAFRLPLPADFAKLHAIGGISFQPTANRSLDSVKLVQVANASEVPKKDYTPLTAVEPTK